MLQENGSIEKRRVPIQKLDVSGGGDTQTHILQQHVPYPRPLLTLGSIIFENAERKGDAVYLELSGKGVRPTVAVTQKVVRFGACPCFERRDVVVGIKNTGELPVRYRVVCSRVT